MAKMTPEEKAKLDLITNLMTGLASAFLVHQLPNETILEYFDIFKDYDDDALKRAFYAVKITAFKFPVPALIQKELDLIMEQRRRERSSQYTQGPGLSREEALAWIRKAKANIGVKVVVGSKERIGEAESIGDILGDDCSQSSRSQEDDVSF